MESIIVKDLDHCFVCGRPHPQMHHAIHGTANRAMADKYHLIIPLCLEHHTAGRDSPHRNRRIDEHYAKMAQEAFERDIGSREDFRRAFGKSYL